MNLEKLKAAIGQNVFVVYSQITRRSEHGKLEQVNEPNNIVLALKPFGHSIIPLDNDNGVKILKVYNKEGIVIYDNEPKLKISRSLRGE